MDDQAAVVPPDRVRNHRLEKRAHDQVRTMLGYRRLHRHRGLHDRDLHVVPELAQRDPAALAQPIVGRDKEQDAEFTFTNMGDRVLAHVSCTP
jgi:hypothetical protein